MALTHRHTPSPLHRERRAREESFQHRDRRRAKSAVRSFRTGCPTSQGCRRCARGGGIKKNRRASPRNPHLQSPSLLLPVPPPDGSPRFPPGCSPQGLDGVGCRAAGGKGVPSTASCWCSLCVAPPLTAGQLRFCPVLPGRSRWDSQGRGRGPQGAQVVCTR